MHNPFVITCPRWIPHPMKSKEWSLYPSQMGERVRICVDLTKLNETVCWETYPLSNIDSLLGDIGDSTVFSKLDGNSGFWQEKLAEKSKLLTTFLTPFGRYCFQWLPSSLKSAPELFLRRMLTELGGLGGVICIMDDILVHSRTQAEHDKG